MQSLQYYKEMLLAKEKKNVICTYFNIPAKGKRGQEEEKCFVSLCYYGGRESFYFYIYYCSKYGAV